MRVGVLGASGFLGRHLAAALRARGDEIVPATLRNPSEAASALQACDALVNLSGEPVAQRWSAEAKRRIMDSRTVAVREFFDALAQRAPVARVYVSASAIGYYGTSRTIHFTEESRAGEDFLGQVCIAWEREAQRAADFGMRVSIVRNALVLGADGGALPRAVAPFRMGLGGKIGDGQQWCSWVHVRDAIAIFLMALDGVGGVLNASAPNPVRNADFTKALGDVLHRPTFFPVPAGVLSAALGEGAYLLTEGQYVVPERTVAAGYTFRFTDIETALRDLLSP
ncbi:MAG: TIGR01777 family oxidoreductase [Candidatus Eremiobacteraeota bacterium]|nr:TIGR01777 family oxidoreductase [Candidatus Eremiobacteraeota bacterium]